MRGPELSIPVHEYLGTKDEVQVFYVDDSDVRNEHFAVCKRTSVISISDNEDQGIGTNPLHAVKEGKGLPRQPVAAHPNKLPGGVPVRIR